MQHRQQWSKKLIIFRGVRKGKLTADFHIDAGNVESYKNYFLIISNQSLVGCLWYSLMKCAGKIRIMIIHHFY